MSPGRPNVATQRSAIRTAVVWEALTALLDTPALEVLDVGGGTGGFAVRVAEQGHRVTVVDPSPDALATLARRSEESAVADRITALQGEQGVGAGVDHGDAVAEAGQGHGEVAAAAAGVEDVQRLPAGGLDPAVQGVLKDLPDHGGAQSGAGDGRAHRVRHGS